MQREKQSRAEVAFKDEGQAKEKSPADVISCLLLHTV